MWGSCRGGAHGRLECMSDPQQGTPRDDQIPPIPPVPDAPPPAAPPAPPTSSEADGASGAQPPAAEPFAPPPPVNPYVQTPVNPYAPQGHNPYVQPVPGAPAPVVPTGGPVPPQSAPPAQPGQPQPGYTPPAEPQPAYAPPGYTQPGYAQPGYAQPGYAQPAYTQPGYTPPAYTQAGVYAPNPPSRLNVPGLVSLIAGGVAFLFGIALAWIPFFGFFFVLIALVGLGLGIFGLIAKNRGKGLAIAGTIVSGFALLVTGAISILMLSIVSAIESEPYDPGYPSDDGQAIDEFIDDELADDDYLVVPDAYVDPDAEIFQPGDTLVFPDHAGNDEWVVTVGEPLLDATEAVLAAASYNPEPPEGSQYLVVPLTITYLGEERRLPVSVMGTLITPAGEGHRLHWAMYGDSIYDGEELGTGDSAEVSAIFLVPSADVPGSILELSTYWADGYVAIG